jgi:hypothetical protein
MSDGRLYEKFPEEYAVPLLTIVEARSIGTYELVVGAYMGVNQMGSVFRHIVDTSGVVQAVSIRPANRRQVLAYKAVKAWREHKASTKARKEIKNKNKWWRSL